jgi:hypothetical protein
MGFWQPLNLFNGEASISPFNFKPASWHPLYSKHAPKDKLNAFNLPPPLLPSAHISSPPVAL